MAIAPFIDVIECICGSSSLERQFWGSVIQLSTVVVSMLLNLNVAFVTILDKKTINEEIKTDNETDCTEEADDMRHVAVLSSGLRHQGDSFLPLSFCEHQQIVTN
jgi:hypothetical protein